MKMKLSVCLVAVLCVSMLSGCASTPKNVIAAPDFNKRSQAIKKVGVLLAGTYIFELGAGGSKTLDIERSKQAAPILTKVSVDQLSAAGYSVKLLKTDEQTLKFTTAFNNIPREDLSRYTYSARKVEAIPQDVLDKYLAAEDLDALVLIRGIDHVSSAGRNAARVAIAILGVGVSSGIAHFEMAMLDKTSAFIFYSHKYEDGKELLTEKGANYLFNEIMIDLKSLHRVN